MSAPFDFSENELAGQPPPTYNPAYNPAYGSYVPDQGQPPPAYSVATHGYPQTEPPRTNAWQPNTVNPADDLAAGGDPEEGHDSFSMKGFDDKVIRRGFIQKVFATLTLQLLLTIGIVCVIYFVPDINNYVRANNWVWITSFCITFAIILALACSRGATRKWPLNFIALLIFTVFESIMVGAIVVYYDARAVGMAFAAVFVITFFMFLLGFQKKIDLTPLVGVVSTLTLCLIMMAFWGIFWGWNWTLAYAVLGTILFSLWLVIDVQMVVGGKHKIQIDPEEYIFAALNIYLDIINIFLFLLMIFGNK